MGSEYKPTVPRGPIAAMFPSPGPKYPLPTLLGVDKHDFQSVHTKAPCYSFSGKYSKTTQSCSPGPCYYPDPSILRTGKDGIPKFSLSSRSKEWASDKTPGPGLYAPEKNSKTYRSSPAYSFGLKRSDKNSDITPGTPEVVTPQTPGPGAYNTISPNMYKNKAPIYSMTSRNILPSDTTQKPSPATYYQEEVFYIFHHSA
ncbi:outer dense fiber protein 3-like [Octopus sinensis]|uniref:Outer dense fiber protein 3-like n=1 Tax=Octopus sinensis TaxID=2607531 RepID=A0A6P7U9B7_9MOLL|nr:outer dense fiber protein 3-like [Octopus sinensis]